MSAAHGQHLLREWHQANITFQMSAAVLPILCARKRLSALGREPFTPVLRGRWATLRVSGGRVPLSGLQPRASVLWTLTCRWALGLW